MGGWMVRAGISGRRGVETIEELGVDHEFGILVDVVLLGLCFDNLCMQLGFH